MYLRGTTLQGLTYWTATEKVQADSRGHCTKGLYSGLYKLGAGSYNGSRRELFMQKDQG